ncbi:MAG: DUF6923 family protein, partial [Flavobacteriaceae bacterium]
MLNVFPNLRNSVATSTVFQFKKYFFSILMMLSAGLAIAQTFDATKTIACDESDFYQTINYSTTGSSYRFVKINLQNVAFTQISNLTANGLSTGINSIGYDVVTRFIYGIEANSPNHLYRINSIGQIQDLGTISGLTGSNNAGDFDSAGNYYVGGGLNGNLFKVNISTKVATRIRSLNGYQIADLAFNPKDGHIYAWSSSG